MTNYPYMVSNNKISQIFDTLNTAAKPDKFTNNVLHNLGYRSTNDRAFITLLKKLNFLNSDSSPTSNYDYLKDSTKSKKIIANQIRELYSEMFSINENMNDASDDEIKGAISRITGKEEKDVKRIFSTFKMLCNYADFSDAKIIDNNGDSESQSEQISPFQQPSLGINTTPETSKLTTDFHYNIQIHLPATTDVTVYNAIFKSIKENLL
ncbi:DUF5343 domain-containing protein [Listeria innocua]|uniref:DUF5343 domain-containing protein n=1 Tax=Listeria innocua TaxID=1642 RepID=UPI0016298A27|nr:DUF5343 domain-containing protein [Listeria innocua]MBC1925633.1 DUF5343 domain-containing protein [Listeria innocua]